MTRIPWQVLKGGDADNNAAHFMASAGPEGGDADDAAMHSVAGAGPEGGDTDDGGGAIYVGKDEGFSGLRHRHGGRAGQTIFRL